MEKRQPPTLRGSSLALPTPSVPRQAVPTSRLAPGFRFHPTDEELVVYYLRRKVCRKPFRFEAIAEVDIYKFEPWELHAFSAVKATDQEWHFFTASEKKYTTGSRLNRSTSQGYWKATGKDRLVRHSSEIVGMKKTLVYHVGRAPGGGRTNWVMHEYRLVGRELEKAGVEQNDSFMLCKIFLKSESVPPCSGLYGAFNEEDWEDDADAMVPCGDNVDDEDSQGASSTGKKPKLMFGLFSGSEASSSTAMHEAAAALTQFSAGFLNFSLSAQPNLENHAPPPPKVGAFDSSSLEKSLPPGYLKFITDLEEEREKLKVAVMESEETINSLQATNEQLEEEIRRLRNLHLKD